MNKRVGFFGILLGTSVPSLIGNLLAGKRIIRAGEGVTIVNRGTTTKRQRREEEELKEELIFN